MTAILVVVANCDVPDGAVLARGLLWAYHCTRLPTPQVLPCVVLTCCLNCARLMLCAGLV